MARDGEELQGDSSHAGYFASRFAAPDERGRLRLLEAELDPITFRHLRLLGFADSDRPVQAIDVGAGGGSVARWLAEHSPAGSNIVAADIDTRFVSELEQPMIEGQELDIVTDDLPTLHYDLVHGRILLAHLDDPAAALQKMADAVAPGGWLLVEEWDYATVQPADSTHQSAATVDKVHAALFDLTTALGIDIYLGRRLPDLVAATGLADIDHIGSLQITKGSPAPSMAKASTALLRAPLLDRGQISAQDLDGWCKALDDPTFAMLDRVTVSVWAHRPRL